VLSPGGQSNQYSTTAALRVGGGRADRGQPDAPELWEVPRFVEGVEVIRLEGNEGFARANNEAVRAADDCVQIHGGPPSEAWYKDITLLDLSSR